VNSTHAILIAVVFFIVAINFFMLFLRLRRDRHPKTEGKASEEKEAVKWRANAIQRRLHNELEDSARRVELRNRTLDLYEQVRKKAAAAEKSESETGNPDLRPKNTELGTGNSGSETGNSELNPGIRNQKPGTQS